MNRILKGVHGHIPCNIHVRGIGVNVGTAHGHVAAGLNFDVACRNGAVGVAGAVACSGLFAAAVVDRRAAAHAGEIHAHASRDARRVLLGGVAVAGCGFRRIHVHITACVNFNVLAANVCSVQRGVFFGVDRNVIGADVVNVFRRGGGGRVRFRRTAANGNGTASQIVEQQVRGLTQHFRSRCSGVGRLAFGAFFNQVTGFIKGIYKGAVGFTRDTKRRRFMG